MCGILKGGRDTLKGGRDILKGGRDRARDTYIHHRHRSMGKLLRVRAAHGSFSPEKGQGFELQENTVPKIYSMYVCNFSPWADGMTCYRERRYPY
jgi:hypothetical protein